jgi:hypothetical protein
MKLMNMSRSPIIRESSISSPKTSIDFAHIGAQFKTCQFRSQADRDNQNQPITSTPETYGTNGTFESVYHTKWREGRTKEGRLEACKPMERYLREEYKDEGSTNVRVNRGKVFIKIGCNCRCNHH